MDNKTPEETLLIETQLHWVVFVIPVVISIALAYFIYYQRFSFVLNYVALGLIVYLLGDVIIRYLTIDYMLTSQRLVIRRGLIFKRTWDIPLSQVESTELVQTLLGKMLGYGNILIDKTGGNTNLLDAVDNALAFRQQIFMAIEKNHENK